MATRDDVVQLLAVLRIATTDQIATALFAGHGSPGKRASETLRQLENDGIALGEMIAIRHPKVWRLTKRGRDLAGVKHGAVPIRSTKTQHWLAIGDLYIELAVEEKPIVWHAEYREAIENGKVFAPDVWMVWKRKPVFAEVQRTPLTSTEWRRKWAQYDAYYARLPERKIQPTGAKPVKPGVWVISRQQEATIGRPVNVPTLRIISDRSSTIRP